MQKFQDLLGKHAHRFPSSGFCGLQKILKTVVCPCCALVSAISWLCHCKALKINGYFKSVIELPPWTATKHEHHHQKLQLHIIANFLSCSVLIFLAIQTTQACVTWTTAFQLNEIILLLHSSLTHLQWVLHILISHYQHSCWQCSSSSFNLPSAHWEWWVLRCLLLEISLYHTTATLHSLLLFYAPIYSLVALFQWLGWWMSQVCLGQHLFLLGEC